MRVFAPLAAVWLLLLSPVAAQANDVRLKDLGHFLGWRDNALVGYGIVTGLAGSGDSPRSAVTRQALSNVLSRLGANVPSDLLQSRNVAAVIVTATLPPSANVGDRIDVTVTSIGDARSLAGGMLLMTPLLGPDRRPYALAQGSLVVGGYNFQDSINVRQKNYPTSGIVVGGATVETAVTASIAAADGRLTFVLRDPDFTTAQRIADRLNGRFGAGSAAVRGADAVTIDSRTVGGDSTQAIASIETLSIVPDRAARVVINERTGTVVAGGGIRVSSVVVAQGDIKVAISVDRQASPYLYGTSDSIVVAPTTRLDVSDRDNDSVIRLPDSTVGDVVRALARAKVSTRNTIAVLQAIKAAGALHADIIVQ
jgi:flagellar P-ring protein precursor FlgI